MTEKVRVAFCLSGWAVLFFFKAAAAKDNRVAEHPIGTRLRVGRRAAAAHAKKLTQDRRARLPCSA
jgi:hypothetical protein